MRNFFYGWIIAAASGIGIGCGVAVLIPSTLGLLVGPLGKDLGWAPQAIYLCPLVSALVTVVVAAPVGSLVDRYGVRKLVAWGFIAEAAITASFYFLGSNIIGLYARYALYALLGTSTTAVAFTVLISSWFDRRRGLALGIALAGTGFGGAAWSLLAQYLFDHYGWRNGFVYMAGVIIAVLAVLMVVLRETPQSVGQTVDGIPAVRAENKAGQEGMTLKEASSTGLYWLMFTTFLIVVSAVYTVMLHLVPMLKQRGIAPQTAAQIQASLWIALVFGRVITGWLMDRIFAPYVAILFLTPSVIGMSMLASGATDSAAVFAAMMVGATAGAEIDVVAFLCSRYFGLKHYSSIYGSFFSIVAIGTALGPALAARLLPILGGYAGVLWFESALLVVGILLFLKFPRFGEGMHKIGSKSLSDATIRRAQ